MQEVAGLLSSRHCSIALRKTSPLPPASLPSDECTPAAVSTSCQLSTAACALAASCATGLLPALRRPRGWAATLTATSEAAAATGAAAAGRTPNPIGQRRQLNDRVQPALRGCDTEEVVVIPHDECQWALLPRQRGESHVGSKTSPSDQERIAAYFLLIQHD